MNEAWINEMQVPCFICISLSVASGLCWQGFLELECLLTLPI